MGYDIPADHHGPKPTKQLQRQALFTCCRCGEESPRHPSQGSTSWCPSCYEGLTRDVNLLTLFSSPHPKTVAGIRLLLEGLEATYPGSFDLESDHLRATPHRVARMFTELCWGLGVDAEKLLSTSFEETDYHGIVAVTNIGFTSLCKHHFAIFRGVAHVAYVPGKRLVGLSKINRVVEAISARPQVQEHITFQIAETITKALEPAGVAVVLEGTHDCIEVRGVRSKGSVTKTAEMRGIFLDNSKSCKDEFMQLIARSNIQ